MIRRSIAVALAAAALFVTADMSAYAVPAPIGRIARAEGEVTVRYKDSDSFVSVWRREKVGVGDTLATGADGTAELEFPDGARLVLGPSGTLGVTGIALRRETGYDRIVCDISVRLDSGVVRAAAPAGGAFTLTLGTGTIMVASSPQTGADITAAMGVFAWGEYASVAAGCAFFSDRAGRLIALCAAGGRPSGLRYGPGAPVAVGESLIDLAFSDERPPILPDTRPVREITVDGRTLASGADGAFHLPGPRRGVTIEGTAEGGRAVVITGGGGAINETIPADESGAWRYAVGPVGAGGLALTVDTVDIGPPPDFALADRETITTPEGQAPPIPPETVDAEAVAERFVRDFSAALARGDTGALSDLVSPDYSGAAGGANRAALLRGVSDFFRAGGTLAVAAYVTGASVADGGVIATMSFSARVSGLPRSGNLRLWLTADGVLTHAEGQWVL